MTVAGAIYGTAVYGTSRYRVVEAQLSESMSVLDSITYTFMPGSVEIQLAEAIVVSDNIRVLYYGAGNQEVPLFIDGNLYGSDVPVIMSVNRSSDTPTIKAVNADNMTIRVDNISDIPSIKNINKGTDTPVIKKSHMG
jgi:hypothetical protein